MTATPNEPVQVDLSALIKATGVQDERVPLAVPPEPAPTPLGGGLVAVGKELAVRPAETKKALVCHQIIGPNSLAQAKAEAAQVFPELFANTQAMMAYGLDATQGVNDLVDRLLKQVSPIKIPELIVITKDLNDNMRGIKRKYDVSDPKVRAQYEKAAGKARGFWHKVRDMAEMLREDITKTETQLEKVRVELNQRGAGLLVNVGYYDEFYKANEAEIGNLIYKVAVMELLADIARDKAAAVVIGDSTLGDRGREEQQRYLDFARNTDIKVQEFKARLFIAWSTSPQIRTMRSLDVGLAIKLDELVNVVLPTMKATLVQWRMMMEAQQAAQLGSAVAETANEWTTAYFAAGAEIIPAITRMVEEPTYQAATFAAVADYTVKQADGVIEAMEMGVARRRENDESIVTSVEIMRDANKKVSDHQLAEIVGRATKPLEIITSVPAAVEATPQATTAAPVQDATPVPVATQAPNQPEKPPLPRYQP
jgi:uncharacterized protein YaaN involved in tellurite resistance